MDSIAKMILQTANKPGSLYAVCRYLALNNTAIDEEANENIKCFEKLFNVILPSTYYVHIYFGIETRSIPTNWMDANLIVIGSKCGCQRNVL